MSVLTDICLTGGLLVLTMMVIGGAARPSGAARRAREEAKCLPSSEALP
jgi:hypothetical protein